MMKSISKIFGACLLCIATLAMASNHFCGQCYQQKLALWGYCNSNLELNLLYPKWCSEQYDAACAMHIVAKKSDELLSRAESTGHVNKQHWAYIPKGTRPHIPFDYCDACVNNMAVLKHQCQTKALVPLPKSVCSSEYIKFFETMKLGPFYGQRPSFLVQQLL